MAPQPSRLLTVMLRLASSQDAANAAIGDLCEELADRRAANRAPLFASFWFHRRMFSEILSSLAVLTPRGFRSAGMAGRDAVRTVRRSPATSLFIMSVLAVGIAAGTLTFSVVDAVILKPLPIADPGRVVYLPTAEYGARAKTYVTAEVYRSLHDRARTLDSMALASTGTSTSPMMTVGNVSSTGPLTNATADVFHVLRLTAAIGRVWTPAEDAAGVDDVAVLGHRFWRERLGADPAIIGKTVSFPRRAPARVIGVLAEESDTADFYVLETAVWMPTAALRVPGARLSVIARMKPDVTTAQVAAELQQFAGAPEWRPTVQPILNGFISQVRDWMLLALGAAGLVILIACVNAANMLLIRSAVRSHELAIRSSLGASRRRIVVSVIFEGLVLSAGATAAALIFALWGVGAAKGWMLASGFRVFRAGSIALNGRVLAAAIVTSVVTGVVFSLVPAWQMSRTSILSLLKEGSPTSTRGRGRWRSALLAAEMSAVAVLLVVSWMFVLSLIRVSRVDLGLDRSHLLAVHSNSTFAGTVDDLVDRARRVSGVEDVAVGIGASLPLIGHAYGGAWGTVDLAPAGGLTPTRAQPLDYRVSANYFSVAGIRFLRGGVWAQGDTTSIVIDDTTARDLFGSADPIGRPIEARQLNGTFTVVGVVNHVKALGAEGFADYGAAYTAMKPNAARAFAGVFIRTSRPAAEVVRPLSDALQPFSTAVDPVKDPFVVRADEAVGRLTATRRFNAMVLSIFGVIGALIGAAGIYAVMASVVAQSTREIGLRVALGATPADIRNRVLVMAIRHAAAGLLAGLPLAWWLSRGFAAHLFQVTPTDISVYLVVAAAIGSVALAAAIVPSRRAARVDPVVSLRQ